MLLFGLRSSQKIFNALADALQWHLIKSGVQVLLHYWDNYIILGPPHSQLCHTWLLILIDECSHHGVPIAVHNTEGPSTEVTFLGIQIDTIKGELRLPQDKMTRLTHLLEEWGTRRPCTRKELESLIGLLNHACKIVRVWYPFLRRMIDLLHVVHHPASRWVPIRLNQGFRAELAWWTEFVGCWNGISFLHPPSLAWRCVVPGQVGHTSRAPLYCGEGADPNCLSLPGMGFRLGQHAGGLPL